MNKIFLSAALLLLAASLNAQPQGQRPAPPKMKTPTEMAKEKAGKMKGELALSDKQYKKVYKLFKKDFEYRQKAVQDNFSGGMPPQGGGPGMGGGPDGGMMGGGPGMGGGMMGGGPGMGGGMMGGGSGMGGGMMGGGPGMGGEMGGGMPPQGGMQPGGGPGMGPGGDVITDEYLEKQDKKLKKILTEEQYGQWRTKHPAEHLDLPPMELK